MPAIAVVGLKGLATALNELSAASQGNIADRTISFNAQQAAQRLDQDTPVITGRLFRSRVLRKDSPSKQTLGQFAPYANVVNNRRNYWSGAISVSQQWPQQYAKAIVDEWGIIGRRHSKE